MGRDKALLPLSEKPLIQHAVAKLRRICTDVAVLSNNQELAAYAPLVPDLHPNCGPIGGIEAALAHSSRDWNLILPVDLPFLPATFVHRWASACYTSPRVKLAIFSIGERPQPTLLMIHSDLSPHIARAIENGHHQLFQALETAAREIAGQQVTPVLQIQPASPAEAVWFTNLNTPGDHAAAEAHLDLIDPI